VIKELNETLGDWADFTVEKDSGGYDIQKFNTVRDYYEDIL